MRLNNKEFVLGTMKKYGKAAAEALQAKAEGMTGTELYDEYGFIPSFYAAIAKKNMLERPVGFVCRSPKGRVVKLLQPYDSTIFTEEPEEMPAQWGFKWSQNPKHALPFFKCAESPYMKGDCCVFEELVYRSTIDINTFSPSEYPQGWEAVTE